MSNSKSQFFESVDILAQYLVCFKCIQNVNLLYNSSTRSLQTVKSFQTIDELEQFLLNHGENIVDLMGGEIDRIEMKLRVSEYVIVMYFRNH